MGQYLQANSPISPGLFAQDPFAPMCLTVSSGSFDSSGVRFALTRGRSLAVPLLFSDVLSIPTPLAFPWGPAVGRLVTTTNTTAMNLRNIPEPQGPLLSPDT